MMKLLSARGGGGVRGGETPVEQQGGAALRRRRRGGGGLSIHVKDYKNYRAGGEREARVRERRRELKKMRLSCAVESGASFFFPFVFEFVCSSREVGGR